tara:strand:- start:80 stop:811 length:732 start_codon:yes stop_codon:yes gene_type:complete
MEVSSIINSSHQLNPFNKTVLNTTVLSRKDPLRMIQNGEIYKSPRDLRLIIHGSKGGDVPPIVSYLVNQVQQIRGSSVELEILTQDQLQFSKSSSIWLIPLLLLPGKHVCYDVPLIADRLRSQGVITNELPFLGSWNHWLSILEDLIDIESNIARPILIHHPLNNGMGTSFLNSIRKRLNIPIIPWTEWHSIKDTSDEKLSPIPYSLSPNKNTKGLRENDSISSLLEIQSFLNGLIKILVNLP